MKTMEKKTPKHPAEKFMKTFKVPKSEINRMKKEFSVAKEATEQFDAEQLKDFEGMTFEVFDFFEELTGKKVNREFMRGCIAHYLDEGFGVEEIKDYIRSQMQTTYFKENPNWFTVARLFPVQDQDRINMVWDFLAHFQALRNRKIKTGLQLQLRCGHKAHLDEYRNEPYCFECGEKVRTEEWYEKNGAIARDYLLKLTDQIRSL